MKAIMSAKETIKNGHKLAAINIPEESPKRKSFLRLLLSRKTLTFLRIISLVVIAGIIYLQRDKILQALGQSLSIGWWFFFLFPLFSLWNWVAVNGWMQLISATPRNSIPSKTRLFMVRIEAQALNFLLPLASLGGEVLKSTLTATDEGLKSSVPPVILDKIATFVSEVIFVLTGIALFITIFPVNRPSLFICAVLALAVLIILLSWQKIFKFISRIYMFSNNSSVSKVITMLALRKEFHLSLYKAIGWHFLERILMAMELFVIARALGIPLGLTAVLFASGLTAGFSLLLFFMPGQLGAFEGGLVYAFSLLGLSPTLGLTVALIRRGRQLVTCGLGLFLLFVIEKNTNKRKRTMEKK